MTPGVLHHRRPDLSPLSHPRSILPSSAAPKRDHDEWLVRRRLGGLAVVPAQAQVAAGCAVACPAAVAPRTARGRGDHPPVIDQLPPRRRGTACSETSGVATLRGSGPGGQDSGSADGAGEISGSAANQAQNPDRPARREPHFIADYPRRGIRLAGPASFPQGARAWFSENSEAHRAVGRFRMSPPPQRCSPVCIPTPRA